MKKNITATVFIPTAFNSILSVLVITMSILLLSGCTRPMAGVSVKPWGQVEGRDVSLFTLTNKNGMVVKLTNYGGIITSVIVPDRDGKMEDVVLGFDNLQQYLEDHPCFGTIIGPYANRIRDGQFVIDGTKYTLTRNDGEHCIHGGASGFDKKLWQASEIQNELGVGVRLHHLSKDGEGGFPGNIDATVTYILTDDNAIHIHYEATTDKTTHVSMTHHSYFNLNACKDTIYDHLINIAADQYTEVDSDIVPTGKISTVKGTALDLTEMTPIGKNIFKLDHNGYHFNYVFNKPLNRLEKVIKVYEPLSGRTIEVSTTQPGVQFYSGNYIKDSFVGKYGIKYGPHIAFCLETQHFPDSPNHPNFPTTLLQPGEKYDHTAIYKFGVE
jgi:aldose 1-epimerase